MREKATSAGVCFWLKQAVVDGELVELPELDGRTWAERPAATEPVGERQAVAGR